ncbi:MAG: ATPase [Clostridia bacterium]|nr:ATPase [Clostridia bacterium]
MEIFDVIDQLEDIVESSFTVPILRKTLINKPDIMELLSELRLRLPEDLKQAKWVKEERTRIITEAHQEAANIVKETEDQVAQMVNENEITKKAYEQANEIIESAQKSAREVRLGAKQYVENVLSSLEERLTGQLQEVQAGREELRK